MAGCESLLDVGCGADSPIQAFSDKLQCVGVDAYKPSIEISKKKGIHKRYYISNALNLLERFKPKSFDCVFACEIIEHMPKKQGIELIRILEAIAKKKVVIMTPNGFVPQKAYNNNPWQEHKSGWTSQEMIKRGYKVVGLRGLKYLRGEMSYLKYRPKLLFLLLSNLSQYFVRNKPEYAFQILCIKNLNEK